MTNPTVPTDTAEIRELIRAAGLRCTTARIAVVQALRATTSPVTHGELAEALVPEGFDKATVYRNLIDLTEAGLVSRSELGDHVWRFELRDSQHADGTDHPHFVCVDCGNVTCLPDLEFTPATKRRTSKAGQVTEILLRGHCTECQ